MADKKGKTTNNASLWEENKFELFAEVLANLENNFSISLRKLALKKSANNAVYKHIKNTFEMEMDNKIFKEDNVDQVKGNATKLEYTTYSKNIKGSHSFIPKFLI